ncbi:MAG: septum formation initiator family protein [Patescibacteria group bacterium]|nr:septum formation initiator family protein [Patescibacteria group bacterium]
MQKTITYIISLVIVSYLGYQVYLLQDERFELSEEFEQLHSQQQALEEDNAKLQAEIEYLSDPHNLEKELRARFNYRSPNEKLIIVVPDKGEEATSTEE